MQPFYNQTFVIALSALFIVLVYKLSAILTPFLLGALIAYLTDPLVKKLDRCKIPHLLSVIIVFLTIIIMIVAILLLLTPMVEAQLTSLVSNLPDLLDWAQTTVLPRIKEVVNIDSLKASLSDSLPKAGSVFQTLLSSGYTLLGWSINLVLTPVITFYLLRDWDKLRAFIKKGLPQSKRDSILTLANQCDEVLSAFFRGQFIVMLCLALIYGIGLTLVGLKYGLIIGIIGGLLSIVPYLGSGFVLVTATVCGLAQFENWHQLWPIWGVFLFGQVIEGWVLTPNLVGERIGLHPVAVIFSVMAGGTLFGFFGVLVALPIAAVTLVLLRSFHHYYFAK